MRSKRRGSVAVLAMIMVVSTSVLAIALVSLSASVRTKQTRLEDRRVAQDAFDGGVDVVVDMADRGALVLPQTVDLTLGDAVVSLSLTDATGLNIDLLGISVTTSAYTVLVDGTVATRLGKYRFKRVVGRGRLSSVWYQALYLDQGITTIRNITTGAPGLDGDAWFNGSVTFLGLGTHFGGDLTSTGLISPLTVVVDGKKTASSRPIDFPSVDDKTYKDAAATTLGGDTSLNGYVFVSGNASGYPLVYVGGKLDIQGSFSGTGVIIAKSVTVSGNITTGVNDHLVIISQGNVDVNAGVDTVDAYIYSKSKLTIASSGVTPSFLSGVVAMSMALNSNVSFSYDPFVRDNPVEAWRLKLPGCWP